MSKKQENFSRLDDAPHHLAFPHEARKQTPLATPAMPAAWTRWNRLDPQRSPQVPKSLGCPSFVHSSYTSSITLCSSAVANSMDAQHRSYAVTELPRTQVANTGFDPVAAPPTRYASSHHDARIRPLDLESSYAQRNSQSVDAGGLRVELDHGCWRWGSGGNHIRMLFWVLPRACLQR